MKLGSLCYYPSTSKTTYSKARASCQKQGGDLAVPTNNNENNAIWNVAKQRKLSNPWIGLVRHKDKKFYTVHGVKISYTNWYPREPNGPNHEHCVHLYTNNGGRWNDIPCSNSYHFICQQPLIKRK